MAACHSIIVSSSYIQKMANDFAFKSCVSIKCSGKLLMKGKEQRPGRDWNKYIFTATPKPEFANSVSVYIPYMDAVPLHHQVVFPSQQSHSHATKTHCNGPLRKSCFSVLRETGSFLKAKHLRCVWWGWCSKASEWKLRTMLWLVPVWRQKRLGPGGQKGGRNLSSLVL